MPKNPEQSSKKAVFLTADESIVSLKAQDQPLTAQEKIVLNKIYNESVLRLKRTVRLLNQLKAYLAAQPDDIKQNATDIKQYLIDNNADPDVLHALKMLKRHFYIDITNNSMNGVLTKLQPIKNNTLKVYKGLKGQLELGIEAFSSDPTQTEIDRFKPKTYVFVQKQGQWELSYYEHGVKKNVLNIDDLNPNIKNVNSVAMMKANDKMLMRLLMLHHAKQGKSPLNKVYISNIAKKKQHNPLNREIGYVWSNQGVPSDYFGAIHIDYRLLTTNPFQAMGTLIHEASHRFAWVNDRGYYHQTKNVKSGGTRPYPNDVQANTMRATNNADSYAYFVQDMTGAAGLLTGDGNVPEWFNEEKYKPLPQESWSTLAKLSLFAAASAVVTGGGYCAYKYSRYLIR